jgi:hypothetical protein
MVGVKRIRAPSDILVSTDPNGKPEPQPGHVYVDCGPEFYARHSACFPQFGGPPLTANIGWLGLQHVLENGGSGYFPKRIVLPYLKAKRLNMILGAPEFSMPAYVVYPLGCDRVYSAVRSRSCTESPMPKHRSKLAREPRRHPREKFVR